VVGRLREERRLKEERERTAASRDLTGISDVGTAEPPPAPRTPPESVTAPLRPPAAASPAVAEAPAASAPTGVGARLPLEALRDPLPAPPPADAAARAVASARATLEGPGGAASFRETTAALHAEALRATPPEAPGTLAIVSAGPVRVASPRGVLVPLILSDDGGREHRVTLTIQLDPTPAAAAAPGPRA
jgi:hypothetical protein